MSIETITEELVDFKEETVKENHIVLYNDDVNTFDHVIEMLVKVCEHDVLQAEQCAFIVHYNGKCSVKNGAYKKLEPLSTALSDSGLTVEIN
jgi:ATP-dependent Clp protease adaptor protein ClpS